MVNVVFEQGVRRLRVLLVVLVDPPRGLLRLVILVRCQVVQVAAARLGGDGLGNRGQSAQQTHHRLAVAGRGKAHRRNGQHRVETQNIQDQLGIRQNCAGETKNQPSVISQALCTRVLPKFSRNS